MSILKVKWAEEAAVTVVMAAAGYPGSYQKGAPIRGLNADILQYLQMFEGVTVYHAGTTLSGELDNFGNQEFLTMFFLIFILIFG